MKLIVPRPSFRLVNRYVEMYSSEWDAPTNAVGIFETLRRYRNPAIELIHSQSRRVDTVEGWFDETDM